MFALEVLTLFMIGVTCHCIFVVILALVVLVVAVVCEDSFYRTISIFSVLHQFLFSHYFVHDFTLQFLNCNWLLWLLLLQWSWNLTLEFLLWFGSGSMFLHWYALFLMKPLWHANNAQVIPCISWKLLLHSFLIANT